MKTSHVKGLVLAVAICSITSCLSTKTRYQKPANPYFIAHKIQGVYEFMPAIDADNPRILVLSPVLHDVTNTSYLITVDAVLVQRGQFFDDSSVRQWTALSVKDKAIHYPDGSLYGRFLNDEYTKIWIRNYSSDTDNENEWDSYYKKIK